MARLFFRARPRRSTCRPRARRITDVSRVPVQRSHPTWRGERTIDPAPPPVRRGRGTCRGTRARGARRLSRLMSPRGSPERASPPTYLRGVPRGGLRRRWSGQNRGLVTHATTRVKRREASGRAGGRPSGFAATSMLAKNMIIFGKLTFSVSLSGNSWRIGRDRMRFHATASLVGGTIWRFLVSLYVCARMRARALYYVYICIVTRKLSTTTSHYAEPTDLHWRLAAREMPRRRSASAVIGELDGQSGDARVGGNARYS